MLTFKGDKDVTMGSGKLAAGTYQLNFLARDVCGRTHAAPATVNVRCNNKPGMRLPLCVCMCVLCTDRPCCSALERVRRCAATTSSGVLRLVDRVSVPVRCVVHAVARSRTPYSCVCLQLWNRICLPLCSAHRTVVAISVD